ncbi:MAG TPA: SGNH/GDSL hydrolase family protein [Verrucomicrobiota bacterium]|nr:SGNH/GDSL hydrolase family protein [Verrucomicrobiota bacterium]
MKTKLIPLLFVTLLALPALGQAQKTKKPGPLSPIKDVPDLPRVLLIGDSISIGYTLPTRELLKGKVNVHRIPTNGGPTTRGLVQIDSWLGNGHWDVIHFNWGLHDLKFMPHGKRQVTLAAYERNLDSLVRRLKQTGAKLIWRNTTPVPEGKVAPLRIPADVVSYNAAAKRVMQKHGVSIHDLYTFALARLEKIQRPVNVHFTPEGSDALAGEVAGIILDALK